MHGKATASTLYGVETREEEKTVAVDASIACFPPAGAAGGLPGAGDVEDALFSGVREQAESMISWAKSDEALALEHDAIEERAMADGLELMRLLAEAHMALRAAREERRGDVRDTARATRPAGTVTATLTLTGTGTAAQVPSVSAGFSHTCAVKTDHTLWCWGSNGEGEFGDGTTTGSLVPVQVSGHATDWASVSAGDTHTCAVKTDHTLWCWGANLSSELGDGTTADSLVPVQVSGHATDWASVSAGSLRTCAVKTDHSLWCWGYNGDGELGDGTTTGSLVPVQVSGHATDWAAGFTSIDFTCAVKTEGTVWCWGENPDGELGDGTTTSSLVPVQVSGHATDWAALSAGVEHTCAVKAEGTVWCWGDNYYGDLGNGTTTGSPVPVQVSGM